MKPEGTVFSETSPEFRKGFAFAINALHDQLTHKSDTLIWLINSTKELIDSGTYWYDTKIIERQE